MFRTCSIAFALALFAGVAMGQGTQKRERPPANYSGRAQLYDAPLSVASPKPAAIPDDQAPTTREAPAVEGVTRVIPMIIQPTAQNPDSRSDYSTFDRTDPFLGLRDNSLSNKAGSGWGWLADGMASNLAARAMQQDEDDRSANGRDNNDSGRTDFQTNRMTTAYDDPSSVSATNQSSSRAVISEPALGWLGDSQNDAQQASDVTPKADRNLLGAAQQDISAGTDWSAPSGSGVWDSPSFAAELAATPSLFDLSAVSPTLRDAPRDIPAPTPVAAPDARFGDGDRFKTERFNTESPGSLFSSSAAVSDFGGFKPFSVGPLDSPAVDIKPASVSLPTTPISAEAPASKLGGMGTENDRFTPKTLPW